MSGIGPAQTLRRLNRSHLVLGLALLVSLGVRGLPLEQRQRLADYCRTGLVGSSQWLFAKVIKRAHDQEKHRFLLNLNMELALDVMMLREYASENQRLRQALEFKNQRTTDDYIPAEVIARDPDPLYDTVVVNAGLDRGIKEDWAVVTPAGLVGHIAQVEGRRSVVRLIMRSRISALIQERRIQGMVYWDRGKRFRMAYVEGDKSIKQGDKVVTSGLGGRFPSGVVIGRVVEVLPPQTDPLFVEIYLESAVDFLGLEEVFILRPPNPLGG
ncbi:MAG: rod shape-determining protein MreC [Candidatus Latescibacteria bacterium]|nr:rod shape-determining protein MreC [Candidatus Latescibacterota bacterium]